MTSPYRRGLPTPQLAAVPPAYRVAEVYTSVAYNATPISLDLPEPTGREILFRITSKLTVITSSVSCLSNGLWVPTGGGKGRSIVETHQKSSSISTFFIQNSTSGVLGEVYSVYNNTSSSRRGRLELTFDPNADDPDKPTGLQITKGSSFGSGIGGVVLIVIEYYTPGR